MDIFYSGKKKTAAAAILTIVCCILMVAFPSTVLRSARKAIDLWMLDVLPALLPFFICSGFLQNLGVDTLICGGIGGGARTALAEAGIKLFPGVQGGADESVAALLNNTLLFNPNTVCNHHHDHGEGHDCGSHDCGSHSCGEN